MTTTSLDAERGASRLLKALLLVAIVGAINWGLIGLFNWNLVDAIFGGGTAEQTSAGSRIVYALVGLSGLAALIMVMTRRTSMGAGGGFRAS
jgi:uncharacterized membrane protein YuzA (DUF378 family)